MVIASLGSMHGLMIDTVEGSFVGFSLGLPLGYPLEKKSWSYDSWYAFGNESWVVVWILISQVSVLLTSTEILMRSY